MSDKDYIFLAHVKEDKPAIRKIWQGLSDKGFEPWLDEYNLVGGVNWRVAIPEAIKNSKVFVACLSQQAVEKIGYIQTELRIALSTYSERPINSIFIIPLRLDDCNMRSIEFPALGIHISDLQWIDYWKEDGFEQLLRALQNAGCKPTTRKLPTNLLAVFFYGDYLVQLFNQSLPRNLRQRLVEAIHSLTGLPSSWKNTILTTYLSSLDIREAIDSLTSNLPKTIENVLMLGISYCSLQNSVNKYPNEAVNGELQRNITQFLDRLQTVNAPVKVQQEMVELLEDVENYRRPAEKEILLNAIDRLFSEQILPWLNTLPCENGGGS